MNIIARRGAVAALLVLSAACESVTPTSPPRTGQQPLTPPPSPPTQPPTTFPPQSGPSRTFIFDHELEYPVSTYTRESHFVLYDNGAFVLTYVGRGAEYRGGYTEANGVISFAWGDWSAAGPWAATGTIQGDTLTVRYNIIMQLTDFEDAAYARSP